ncbi:MAG: hypothetical protein OXJ52_05365 [Oligoflexia bacterium]|nr:hypothetical protein [Oligoflexia bacterium]
MRLILKLTFLSFLFAFSFKSFAGNYVSVFKPGKQVKTLSEFKKDIREDVLQLRSIMSVEDNKKKLERKKTIELVRNRKASPKNPIEI